MPSKRCYALLKANRDPAGRGNGSLRAHRESLERAKGGYRKIVTGDNPGSTRAGVLEEWQIQRAQY